ncbi:MAG: KdsC family phosphatase [Bacteroidia bacterium]
MNETNIFEQLAGIRAFVFDIDGVLTAGQVLVTEEGHQLRSVNIKDGYALQHAVKLGYHVAVISGGRSQGMQHRFQGLGLSDIHLGQSHKVEAYEAFKAKHGLSDAQIAYMGDDMPDLPLLERVGLPCCPADACTDVLEAATYISPIAGGYGCARELIERTLKIQGTWLSEESHRW